MACMTAGRGEESAMSTLAQRLAAMSWLRFGGFHGGGDGDFGAVLVGLVLIGVVAWVMLRNDRDAA
jgi:hypothetical protein